MGLAQLIQAGHHSNRIALADRLQEIKPWGVTYPRAFLYLEKLKKKNGNSRALFRFFFPPPFFFFPSVVVGLSVAEDSIFSFFP